MKRKCLIPLGVLLCLLVIPNISNGSALSSQNSIVKFIMDPSEYNSTHFYMNTTSWCQMTFIDCVLADFESYPPTPDVCLIVMFNGSYPTPMTIINQTTNDTVSKWLVEPADPLVQFTVNVSVWMTGYCEYNVEYWLIFVYSISVENKMYASYSYTMFTGIVNEIVHTEIVIEELDLTPDWVKWLNENAAAFWSTIGGLILVVVSYATVKIKNLQERVKEKVRWYTRRK